MQTLVIDFETHREKGYSLKDMPTMQYIRDPRFRVIGASIKEGDEVAQWLEGGELTAFIASQDWHNTVMAAHNAQFDALILTEYYKVIPRYYVCTYFAARYMIAQGLIPPDLSASLDALAPLVGLEKGSLEAAERSGEWAAYANVDAEICYRLFQAAIKLVPRMELDLIDLHVRMAVEPKLDLDKEALRLAVEKDKALEAEFPLIRKDEIFAGRLKALGVTPEYKTTAKGNTKLAVSKTDSFMQRLLEHDSEEVVELAELRLKAGSTIERSRAQRFLDVGTPFPIPLLYYGAHTGRDSGLDKLNAQNLPRKGPLRTCLRAPDGYVLVVVDSSQIEVVVNAYQSGQESLLNIFRNNGDPYVDFAARYLYHIPHSQVTPDQRQVAKAAVLALGFGQGADGFLRYCSQYGIPMDIATAHRVVNVYREAYQEIVSHWAVSLTNSKRGYQDLLSGRKIIYPEMQVNNREISFVRPRVFQKGSTLSRSKLWHGLSVENETQANARDVVFWQALQLSYEYPIVNLVHDEAVLCVPEGDAEAAKDRAEHWFHTPPPFAPNIPVRGEAKITKVYCK